MRKTLLLFIAVFSLPILTVGQVYNYVSSQSVGTYSPISGGTVVATETGISSAPSMDDVIYNLPYGTIPLAFIFNETGYTGLNISSNGFITFGTTVLSSGSFASLSAATSFSGTIAAVGKNLQRSWLTSGNVASVSNNLTNVADLGSAQIGDFIGGYEIPSGTTIKSITGKTISISAKSTSTFLGSVLIVAGAWSSIRDDTLGSAPKRVFVIQYVNFKRFGSTLSAALHNRFNFQFRLFETSNKIEVVYVECLPVSTITNSIQQVGLCGPDNIFPVNINNRMNTIDVKDNWLDSSPKTKNNIGMIFNNGDPSKVIPNGLTYTWEVYTINPANGGEIAGSQTISSKTTPTLFTSVSLPNGHYERLEYKWQSTTSDPGVSGFELASWVDIASSKAATYDAGALTLTTRFRRLPKGECLADWSSAVASNVVQINLQSLTINMACQMPAVMGISSNPYLIANFDHLLWMAANTTSWNKHFKQTANIDTAVTPNACFNGGAGWQPVGVPGQGFQGNYDVDYHAINNLYINRPGQSRVGFFGYADHSSSINRLLFTNAQVTGNDRTDILAGDFKGSALQVSTAGTHTGTDFTGGFAGIIESNGSISQCLADVNIYTTGSSDGFVGYACTILVNCYAVRTIHTNGAPATGFIGTTFESQLSNAYLAVLINESTPAFKGGLIFTNLGASNFNNNFFDNNLNTLDFTGGATPRTTALMKTQSNFNDAGWDFSTPIWAIDPAINNGYPYLGWQNRFVSEVADLPVGTIVIDDTWTWNGVPLEWLLVDKYDPVGYTPPYYDRVALMTRQHIHEMPYRINVPDNNYEYSIVRQYLNTDFYDSFSYPFKDLRTGNRYSSFHYVSRKIPTKSTDVYHLLHLLTTNYIRNT